MAGARKKVVVRSLEGSLTWGYLPANGFVHNEAVELLDTAGKVISLPFKSIRTIAFVKDFNLEDRTDPERLGRRTFPARPRMEGLWLKVDLADRESLEGLAPFDMAFVDGLLEDRGFTVMPPDPRSNTIRLFVARHALASVQVLGFIATPAKPRLAKHAVSEGQGGLFDLQAG